MRHRASLSGVNTELWLLHDIIDCHPVTHRGVLARACPGGGGVGDTLMVNSTQVETENLTLDGNPTELYIFQLNSPACGQIVALWYFSPSSLPCFCSFSNRIGYPFLTIYKKYLIQSPANAVTDAGYFQKSLGRDCLALT